MSEPNNQRLLNAINDVASNVKSIGQKLDDVATTLEGVSDVVVDIVDNMVTKADIKDMATKADVGALTRQVSSMREGLKKAAKPVI